MRSIQFLLISTVLANFRTRLALQTESLALRHHIIVLRRSVPSRPKLQTWDRFQGLQGILFTYRTFDGSGDPVYRLKPDLRFCLNGKQAKYLSRKGDPLRSYFPQTTVPNDAKNTKINVIIAEGEFKTPQPGAEHRTHLQPQDPA